jgi:hypothetical protein
MELALENRMAFFWYSKSKSPRGIHYYLIEEIKRPFIKTSVQIYTGRKLSEKMYINQGDDNGVNYHRLFLIFTCTTSLGTGNTKLKLVYTLQEASA